MQSLKIDILTIMVTLSVFNFVATFFMVVYTRLTRSRGALSLFVLGKLAQGLSWGLRVLVYLGWQGWIGTAASVLLVAGFALESALFLAFKQGLGRRTLVFFVASFASFAACVVAAGPGGTGAAILANVAILLAYLLYMSVAAVRLIASRSGTPFQRILGLIYGTFPLASSVLYALAYDEVTREGMPTTGIGLLYYFMIWTMQIVGSVGYLLMVKEKDELNLAEIASTDALTGILNRRAFYERAEVLAANAARAGEEMTVVSLDLDRFKSINDHHGHHEGDLVIQRFCSVMARAVRKGDLFARHGGEEFIVLLPRSSKEEALAVAARMRDSLARSNGLAKASGKPACTVSLGLATGKPSAASDLDRLVARSDKALYASKRAGRDRASWLPLEPEGDGDDEGQLVLGPGQPSA